MDYQEEASVPLFIDYNEDGRKTVWGYWLTSVIFVQLPRGSFPKDTKPPFEVTRPDGLKLSVVELTLEETKAASA